MSNDEIEIPKGSVEKLENLAKEKELLLDDLFVEYRRQYSRVCKKYEESGQKMSADAKHRQALMKVWKDNYARSKVDPYTIVPIGFSGSKKAKTSGNMTSTLFAIVHGEKDLQRISCQGETATSVLKTISLFDQYKDVKLGSFKKGGYSADDRAIFENPIRVKGGVQKVLKHLKIPTVTIAGAGKNVSRLRSDGWTDTTDWRCIRGMISRKWSRDRKLEERDKKGKITQEYEEELATYTVIDDTILNEEPEVLEDGQIIPPGFTCWIGQEMQTYDVDDECLFFGSISYSKYSEEYQMNCYLVLPTYIFDEGDE